MLPYTLFTDLLLTLGAKSNAYEDHMCQMHLLFLEQNVEVLFVYLWFIPIELIPFLFSPFLFSFITTNGLSQSLGANTHSMLRLYLYAHMIQ
jgi:hypothetical protein